MSINTQDKYWHERYEAMSKSQREDIDCAFGAAIESLKDSGYEGQLKWDDRAEALIAAITRYIEESKSDNEI